MTSIQYMLVRDPPKFEGEFPLDQNILKAGSKVLESANYGASAWTRQARVSVQLADRTIKNYFLKTAMEGGKLMMAGEFASMSELFNYLPTFVPKPIAWGKYEEKDCKTFFFLQEFLDMDGEMPDPASFCECLAQLHQVSESPTGKFGFHVSNCQGKIVQHNDWKDNWCAYFTELIKNFQQVELSCKGVWPEGQKAFDQMCEHAIPQILGPLQSDGRVLKPCLVHGDLWEQNTSTNLKTGEPVVFDAACMYAHNEYDMGMWRHDHFQIGKAQLRHYLEQVPPSPPVEQWDDRNRLYSIKFNLAVNIGWPDSTGIRERLMKDIQFLNEKYPPENDFGLGDAKCGSSNGVENAASDEDIQC